MGVVLDEISPHEIIPLLTFWRVVGQELSHHKVARSPRESLRERIDGDQPSRDDDNEEGKQNNHEGTEKPGGRNTEKWR